MGRGAGLGRLPFSGVPIGSIDFPMPKKTHRGPQRRSARIALKFFRGTIAKRRMQALAIIVLLDKDLDVGAQLIKIVVVVGMNFFSLEGSHEALASSIVVGIGGPTHAG